MNKKDAELLNGIALAYIGDAVYEVFVRDHLLNKGLTKPGELQRQATQYVFCQSASCLDS